TTNSKCPIIKLSAIRDTVRRYKFWVRNIACAPLGIEVEWVIFELRGGVIDDLHCHEHKHIARVRLYKLIALNHLCRDQCTGDAIISDGAAYFSRRLGSSSSTTCRVVC